jgi:hypothetical protein
MNQPSEERLAVSSESIHVELEVSAGKAGFFVDSVMKPTYD